MRDELDAPARSRSPRCCVTILSSVWKGVLLVKRVLFVLLASQPVQSIATGIEGLDCSKSSPYKLCTTSPIKLYHKRVSQMGFVFPIFWGYKLIDKPVQNLYGLVLQSQPHSIPVAIDCTRVMGKKI